MCYVTLSTKINPHRS